MSLTPIGLPHHLTFAIILVVLGLFAVTLGRRRRSMLHGAALVALGANIAFGAFALFGAAPSPSPTVGLTAPVIVLVAAVAWIVAARSEQRTQASPTSTDSKEDSGAAER